VNATAASILGFLSNGPMTGWELYATIENSIGNFWNVTRSQVYRELRTLAGDELIEIGATGPRDRRVCTITPRGRAVFHARIATMPGAEIIRFPLLLTVFFGDAVPPDVLRAACIEHRRLHAARLAEYERQVPLAKAYRCPALALDFGIAYEQTVIAWIDSLPWLAGQPAENPDAAQSECQPVGT